ncbi:hypothetical protein F7725_010121 [Dissostichus mawsoni]|uniref:Uncharacterized protein n=1 Tax=Dissostichus mawsoni TaxID=36200 RepID=A0A7J5XNE4_DISMA|nr:hypothetical protein F7725_010121 [Dissostichus mawsoni]
MEGSPLSETNTTKGPDFSATGSDPEEVVSFGLREVIRKQRIVSRVCVYSPDLCHKVSRLSRIGDALTVNGAMLRIGIKTFTVTLLLRGGTPESVACTLN